jgi:predicted ATPase
MPVRGPTGCGLWSSDRSRTPLSVPETLAATIACSPQFGEETLDAVAGHLRHSSRLIVLGNCEHVVDAVASLVDALLGKCPDLNVLVTNREPLRLPDETVMAINPTDTPGSDMIVLDAPPDVIELFVRKAKLADPTFELTKETVGVVSSICERLDGLPLAVELAAAPLRALTLRLPMCCDCSWVSSTSQCSK